MEETGIVRRLDALGRIVIPREFRKLHRIEVGDPIEMRTNAHGEIILRKVDLSAQLRSMSTMALDALGTHIEKPIGVCSVEEWLLSPFGKSGKDADTAPALQEAVEGQKPRVFSCDEIGVPCRYARAAVYPVPGETAVFGALVLFTDSDPTPTESALMETAARMVGAGVQNF